MPARTCFALLVSSLVASGCCCFPGNCGPHGHGYGGECCFCWPKPIVWNGSCNECGPGPCESCADCCGECGIIPFLRRAKTCGMGCGEIYVGEWISDPPDCCDPCDQCYGCWTGPHGDCCLGPFQRLLAACHGYKYCPKPCCGPSCGGFCHRGSCGPGCGCEGGAHGVMLGGMAHGAEFSEDVLPPPTPMKLTPTHAEPHSILEENWNIPRSKPVPGKPIHKAQQPPRNQMSGVRRPQMSYSGVGTGVRQANYESR